MAYTIEHMFDYQEPNNPNMSAEELSGDDPVERVAWHGEMAAREQHAADLVAGLDNIVLASNQNLVVLLRQLVEVDEAVAWDTVAFASFRFWVSARYGVSQVTSADWVRVARLLEGLPALTEAFWTGKVSWDQFKEITRIATPDSDAFWAEQVVGLTVTKIRKLRTKPSDADVVQAQVRRGLWWSFSPDTPEVVFQARMPDEVGVKVINALERKADQQEPNPETGVFDGRDVMLVDAFAQIVSESLSADPDPDRATVVISASYDDVFGSREGAARFIDGLPVADSTLDRMLCDSRIQMVIKGEHSIVGVGRTTRSIPPWLARVVKIRDGGCQFDGCEHTKWVHIHHIWHWSKGGPTDLWNLICLCLFHHQYVHEYGFTVDWGPNGKPIWKRHARGKPWHPTPPVDTKHIRTALAATRQPVTTPNRNY